MSFVQFLIELFFIIGSESSLGFPNAGPLSDM